MYTRLGIDQSVEVDDVLDPAIDKLLDSGALYGLGNTALLFALQQALGLIPSDNELDKPAQKQSTPGSSSIPKVHARLVKLSDYLGSRAPGGKAAWEQRILSNIDPDSDLSSIADRLMLWLLTDEQLGAKQSGIHERPGYYDHVIDLYWRATNGYRVDRKDWQEAADRGRAAALPEALAASAAGAGAAQDIETWLEHATAAIIQSELMYETDAWSVILHAPTRAAIDRLIGEGWSPEGAEAEVKHTAETRARDAAALAKEEVAEMIRTKFLQLLRDASTRKK